MLVCSHQSLSPKRRGLEVSRFRGAVQILYAAAPKDSDNRILSQLAPLEFRISLDCLNSLTNQRFRFTGS